MATSDSRLPPLTSTTGDHPRALKWLRAQILLRDQGNNKNKAMLTAAGLPTDLF